MNNINLQKYGYAPNAIEKKAVEIERFREIYNFYRLVKVLKINEKTKGTIQNWRKSAIGGRAFKKERRVPGNLYKSITENISFFNREQVFVVRKIVKISNIYHCWISKEKEDKVIAKRFLRQELYALNDQFD